MTEQEQAELLTMMGLIAEKHNCTVAVDFDTNTICFEGNPSRKLALAKELDEILI